MVCRYVDEDYAVTQNRELVGKDISMLYSVIKELFNISEANGFTEDEIAQVKSLHGKIPFALELYYREVGRDEKINHTQNNLIIPWKYSWPKSESHLIIYAENQGVCFWGVSLDDLNKDDPPIYVTFDNVVKAKWECETNKLSDFMIAMAHIHAAFALPFCSEDMFFITKSDLDVIRNHFIKKCESLTQWVDGGAEFFGNHVCDSIVTMRNGNEYDLYYGSGNKENFGTMDKILSELGSPY